MCVSLLFNGFGPSKTIDCPIVFSSFFHVFSKPLPGTVFRGSWSRTFIKSLILIPFSISGDFPKDGTTFSHTGTGTGTTVHRKRCIGHSSLIHVLNDTPRKLAPQSCRACSLQPVCVGPRNLFHDLDKLVGPVLSWTTNAFCEHCRLREEGVA